MIEKLLPVLSLLAVASFALGCARGPAARPLAEAPDAVPGAVSDAMPAAAPDTASGASLEERLTPLQYQVTQCSATEPPFRNAYWDNHEPGLYLDVVSGVPLFSSEDKFDSGTGWPSFTRPLDSEQVVRKEDRTLGMVRTEVRTAGSDSHLGHLFADGPAPTGQRYCINSAALRFVPLRDLEREGLGEYVTLFPEELRREAGIDVEGTTAGEKTPSREVAILAGGCFWGMEDILRRLPGVVDTEVGYTGGSVEHPTYDDLHGGRSGHAESIRITFDPTVLSYGKLLDTFFRMHDPTTKNRQGNDVGSQYRSAIFTLTPAQEKEAEAAKERAAASGRWKKPIVTEITPASTFWPAEDYHQDYLVKHPGGYTCHYLRD